MTNFGKEIRAKKSMQENNTLLEVLHRKSVSSIIELISPVSELRREEVECVTKHDNVLIVLK